ncbi:hypothetical protein [Ramlibacter sp.]|uniref:hypothetical protein n=1 Tax=Ramlibacter sp. TaxID=1917967 RepID=UPI0035B365B7
MLHRNMNAVAAPARAQHDLDDILGSLYHARRKEDLGRLALVTYWEVRRWARETRHEHLAEVAGRAIIDPPLRSRDDFLGVIDEVIAELEGIRRALP